MNNSIGSPNSFHPVQVAHNTTSSYSNKEFTFATSFVAKNVTVAKSGGESSKLTEPTVANFFTYRDPHLKNVYTKKWKRNFSCGVHVQLRSD